MKEVTYYYDALGRRMQKSVIDNQNLADPAKTFTRKYLYDGNEIVAEFDASNNMLARYTHSRLRTDDALAVDVTSSGVNAKLAQSSGSYYYLKDALGSITDITNSSGNIIQKYSYASFGSVVKVLDGAGSDITESPILSTAFTFTGRELDRDSGLYYYRARYYDPSTGRFLQKDPEPGGLQIPLTVVNKYAYSTNNPLFFIDPTGKSILDILNGVVKISTGIFLAAIASAVAIIDFSIGYAWHVLSGGDFKAPRLEWFNGSITVKNSVLGEFLGRSTTWGPIIFLKPYASEEEWRHEFGHTRQFYEMGGLEYLVRGGISVISDVFGKGPSDFEFDADRRAGEYFGVPICEYHDENHPDPRCRF